MANAKKQCIEQVNLLHKPSHTLESEHLLRTLLYVCVSIDKPSDKARACHFIC